MLNVFKGMKSKKLITWVLFLISILLSSCVSNQPLSGDHVFPTEYPGYILTWLEQQPGEPEHQVRMLITENYLRIEHDSARNDYIIFNKNKNVIYRYTDKNEAPIVISAQLGISQKNSKPHWLEQGEASQALVRKKPEDSSEVMHYRYSLGPSVCYNVVSVNHYLQDVLPLLKAYQELHVVEQDLSLLEDKNKACYAAINLDDPNKRYEKGFPIREWTAYGYQRFLVDYKMVSLAASNFQ